MKIYLAARYSRHKELQEYAKRLEALGCEITSRWIHGNHQVDDRGLSQEADPTLRIRLAREDFNDVDRASMMISFTEEPRGTSSRGGRHVEFGMALASGHSPNVVIGHRENVFHCLPQVQFFPTFDEFLPWFEEYLKNYNVAS
jgi:hypothetical protein